MAESLLQGLFVTVMPASSLLINKG